MFRKLIFRSTFRSRAIGLFCGIKFVTREEQFGSSVVDISDASNRLASL